MALSFGQTGTADSIDADYLTPEQNDASLLVHIQQDAVDGIARDAIESFNAGGVEVGGLLLGHVEPGNRPVVWVDKFQRVECAHRSGPRFVLDDEDHRTLETSAATISRTSELNVVGFYRSEAGLRFALSDADFEIARRYFSDPFDLILLVRPGDLLGASAQLFAHGKSGDMQPTGGSFPFRGRMISKTDPLEPDTAKSTPTERGRRIVPDFAISEIPKTREVADEVAEPASFRKKWPLLAALLLVGGVLAALFYPRGEKPQPAPAAVAETAGPIRPLGLYVDPSGSNWRVSWNPSATALQDAASVALFVRDGEEDQSRIDLTPKDLQSGTYEYQPKGRDVTFRLEVTGRDNHVSSESFRFMKAVAAAPVMKLPEPAPPPPAPVNLKATHKVAPVVPASIRPRIHGTIGIDVRVRIDRNGRVTSAAPVTKARAALNSFLTERALAAAKQWRFESGPGGTEIIHFTFDR